MGVSTLNKISPVAIGTTATRLPAGNPSRASHCPCNLIFGKVFRFQTSPAISIFKLRAFICYPCLGRAARSNGLPLVSYPFQLAWHGHFVSHWKGQFRFHTGTIPKQIRIATKIFKNLLPTFNQPESPITRRAGRSPQCGIGWRGNAAGARQSATPTRQNLLHETVRPETGGLLGKRRKAIRKQSAQSGLPSVCPFGLYAFCMLSEHRFGKVGKSQKAHRSAHSQTSRKCFLRVTNGFFQGF